MNLMLLLVILVCCGLSAKCQDFTFTEPGSITETSIKNASNTTYLIKAPIGQKIELTINSFQFVPCQLETSNLIIEKTNEACLKNHHIIIKNHQGDLDDEFYKSIMQNSTEWVFCDCNRPYKKFLSLTNELSISNHMIDTITDINQSYSLDYKFLESEFKETGEIRVVQDAEKLSPVNGYLHTVRVPANHHLRISGRSNKCKMPSYTVLSKNSTNVLFNRITKIVDLIPTEFTSNNCSFLFDLSEPHIFPKSDWYVKWFLQFKSSYDLNDFEIHWSFIKNKLIDEKKSKTIKLPLQYGFDIDEELDFDFSSTNPKRFYRVKLMSSENENGILKDKGYVKSKATGQADLVLPILSKKYKKNKHVLKGFTGAVVINRSSEWSMLIEYRLKLNIGDCDFDESLCGYTNQLEKNGTNVFDFTKSYEILHMPKHESLDAFSPMTNGKNFYMGIKKNNSNNLAVMYSPLIRIQKKRNVDRIQDSINNKLVFISFSYLQQSQTDKLELSIVSQRTDVKEALLSTSPGDFIREINSEKYPENEQIDSSECLESKDVWKRVEKMPVFSCYDFHLEFNFLHGSESSNNTLMGIDNVEINHDDTDLKSCNELGKCNNNGQCYKFNDEPICCCYPGFIGSDCNTEINPCDQITCLNEGQCQSNGLYEYQCRCAPGYTGPHCETEINECSSNPCGENGVCFDKIGSYMCSCHAGYSGKNCNERSEYCNVCNNEGTLNCFEDGALNVVCQCKDGYTGSICDLTINECSSNPCAFGSECIDKLNDFECLCPPDRTGKLCSTKISNCDREEFKSYCLNNGTCIDEINDHVRCACPYDFTGEFCETPITTTNCLTNPCHDGICIEEPTGYRCDCPKGIIGTNCDLKPENPCFGNKCQNGHCFSLDHDYMCKCFDNFSGEFCEKQDCSVENIDQFCVKNNTVEIIKDKRFHDTLECKCMCKNGFRGERCEHRIDLCSVINGLMEQMSQFEVEGAGEYCKNGGVCFHDHEAQMARCKCPDGFEGHRCEEKSLNACLNEPCKFGKCSSSSFNPNDYTCQCSEGWQGKNCDVQKVCIIENDCVGNNTISAKYSYADNRCICKCKIGYEGNECERNHDDCSNLSVKHQCKNGGKCIDKVASYDCECPKEYGGFYCETKMKACAMKPCVNGECEVDNFSEFKCKCDPGFGGPLCDTPINNCEPNICENGAKCHNLIANVSSTSNGFFCDCPSDFGTSSPTCSYRTIDPCAVSPCSNNGECMSTSEFLTEGTTKVLVYNDFKCKCPKDYEGEFCEKQITSCSHNPCQHRGLCRVTMDDHFECKCFPAFTGKFCEHQADQCGSFPCSNGGTCMPTPEGFQCQCPSSFKGKQCDFPVTPCEQMNCSNGGKCLTDDLNVPFCECTNKRYTGTQCEIDLTQFTNVTQAVKAEALLNSDERIDCPILGANTAIIDYLFLVVIISLIIIIIIGAIYVYVQLRIKKFKIYVKKVNNDMEITSEISQLSNRSK